MSPSIQILLMARSANKTVTGLEIEPGHVTAVETRPGGTAVLRAVTAPLGPGVVRDGEVVDIDALAAALTAMFTEHGLSRRVRIGLANQGIVMRTIDLPPITDPKELDSAVRFQAADHIPMPLDQVVMEHQSLGIVNTPDGPRSRVVLIAARREPVERLLEAVRRAGLRAEGIDLSAFAMVRSLARPGAHADGPTLYLSVSGLTNLALADGTVCFFTRVISAGGESIATELSERRGLTLEHARAWLQHVGLTRPTAEIEGQPEVVTETRATLTEGVRRIVAEVRNTIDFHATQEGAQPARHLVLTGSALAIPGLAEALAQGIGLPLEVRSVVEARAGAFGSLPTEALTVAAGLTITEVTA